MTSKCTCATPSKISFPGRRLDSHLWHGTDSDGEWCGVKDLDTEEFLPCILIKTSKAFDDETLLLRQEAEEAEAKAAKREAWNNTKEHSLVCQEVSTSSSVYERAGGALRFDPNTLPEGFGVSFSVVLEALDGTAYAILYNLTANAPVLSSELSTTKKKPTSLDYLLIVGEDITDTEALYEVHIKASEGTAILKRAGLEVAKGKKT